MKEDSGKKKGPGRGVGFCRSVVGNKAISGYKRVLLKKKENPSITKVLTLRERRRRERQEVPM